MALGTARAGSGLSELAPSCISYPYQYPRGSHASRATIITARDCCQSGMGSLGISGYPWVSREGSGC